jgi:alpha-glucosidase (family GH31 glycosyl hydrolase)
MNLVNILGWEIRNQELLAKTQEGILGFSFTGPDTLRIRFDRGETLRSEETFVVIHPPEALSLGVEEHADLILVRNSVYCLEIRKKPFGWRLLSSAGRYLLGTPAPGAIEFCDNTSIARFLLEPDERIYGLGQDPMAQLNHRNQERRMWQEWGGYRRSGNAGIPFMFSDRGYSILLNSAWPARFAIGRAEVVEALPKFAQAWAPPPWGRDISSGETHPDELAIILDEGIMDLFIQVKPSVDELLSGYVDLTGHSPMLPKWAFGFIQCKNRYRTQDELLWVAKEFRNRGIPADVLVIDWLWFKEFGDLEWRKSTFPDAPGAFKQLESLGFRVMQAQHPFIDKTSLKYEQFKQQGFLNEDFVETRPTFDHSNPEARKAWWHEIKRLYEDGIRGYWTDMGELEVHLEGTRSFLGSRERVHNLYSLLWTQGLYENQRRDYGTRVFSLPRTAFAGIQRNSAALWSNDISATWDVFKDQVVIGQGVCLSGQQYWCTDIGGFFTDSTFSAELFIRWLEWGVFCPILRTHGTRPDNEPWSFGPEAERIISGFIRLRYRLLPYIYSLARQITDSGIPMMRAMCIDFADDSIAVAQEHQFMFGPAFLVAPVVEKGSRTRQVYLPDGEWYDFWTDHKYSGKQWVTVPAPLGSIPLFVRAGSIIPMGPVLQHVFEKPTDTLEVHIYPGGPGQFTLYEDDGLSFDYESGRYAKTILHVDAGNTFGTDFVEGDPSFIPSGRRYLPVLHPERQPEPYIEVDCDLEGNGNCTIHALIFNPFGSAGVNVALHLPDGWHSREALQVSEYVSGLKHITWTVFPTADALPVYHRAELSFQVNQGDQTSQFSRCLQWGSGWASRWQMVGHFDNEDRLGLERSTMVETYPDLVSYLTGTGTASWNRNLEAEFNPFGYVDFKSAALADPGLQGVAYARCRIWTEQDMDAYLEVTGDPNLKIWVRGELFFTCNDIVLRQVIPQPVHLNRGWNPILVKTAMNFEKPWSGREYGFTLRVVDDQGNVNEEVRYSPS